MEINEFGKIVEKFWFSIPKRYSNVIIDEFVVMPNHFHGLLKILHGPVGAIHELPLPCGNEPNPEIWKQRRRMLLPKIIGYFKMNTAKQINIVRNFNQIPVWQRNYYENIIHSESEVDNIRGYIRNNPRNWENDENNPHGRSL
jgi:REP element-mobilizing transposase RayT